MTAAEPALPLTQQARPDFRHPVCDVLTVCPWAGYSSILGLNSPVGKMEIPASIVKGFEKLE